MTGPATICQGLLLLINQGNTNYSTSYSFVDLDMFMWFLGIVIGHCGQHVSVELNPDEPLDFQIDVDANCDESNNDTEGAEIDEDFQAEDTVDDEEGTGSDDKDSDFGYGSLKNETWHCLL